MAEELKSSKLVAQLREDIGDGAVVLLVGDGHRYDPLRLKAADEIERLRAVLERASGILNRLRADLDHTLQPNSGFAAPEPRDG